MLEQIEQLMSENNSNIIIELHVEPQKVYNNCRIFESGSINIEHIEHFHQAEGVKASPQLPEALRTEMAQALLRKGQAAGLLDADFRPLGNKTKAAIVADEKADKLGLEPRWKPFEELCGITNLRQTLYAAAGTSKGGSTRDAVRTALK